MFDFIAQPPEVNSALLHCGVGSAPMLAAAAAWEGLSDDLAAAAEEVAETVIEAVPASFAGPTSEAVARRTLSYVNWLNSTATCAEQTANQLNVAANAYETAYQTMVPPLTVYVNLVQTKVLQALNWFGQFSSSIADKEAEYNEMWSRNAEAMMAYRDAVLEGTARTPEFEPAPMLVSNCVWSCTSDDSFDSFDSFDYSGASAASGPAAAESFYESMDSFGYSGASAVSEAAAASGAAAAERLYESIDSFDESIGSFSYPNEGPMYENVAQSMLCMSDIASMASTGLSMVDGMGPMMKGIVPTTAANAVESLTQSEQLIENAVHSPGCGALSSSLESLVAADLGQGVSVGALRVPETWADTSPIVTSESGLMSTAEGLPIGDPVYDPVYGDPVYDPVYGDPVYDPVYGENSAMA
ncbi:PPE family protein [Mycobacterium uberis]|uniref:PPE family protein n=1 Tax=Mycobacterium uberis TaxID=2162698 RepID=A0A3E1HHT2_9MYCO|nr:PPE family protein [Mycobacterium uberis]RFD26002.1 PPE family protein [Mycobacterium uberis]